MSEASPLRLSDAEREHVIEALRTAFTEGRLDLNEFEDRVDIVNAARVEADLAPALVGLPPVHLDRPAPSSAPAGRHELPARRPPGGFPFIKLALVFAIVWMVTGGISSWVGWLFFALFVKFFVLGRRHHYAC